MANIENLTKMGKNRGLSSEEAQEMGRKGGIASGKARAERKTLKEELLLLLSQNNTQEKISLSLIQQAMQGNVKAFETIRDTVGEKPKEDIDVTVKKKLEDVL